MGRLGLFSLFFLSVSLYEVVLWGMFPEITPFRLEIGTLLLVHRISV